MHYHQCKRFCLALQTTLYLYELQNCLILTYQVILLHKGLFQLTKCYL